MVQFHLVAQGQIKVLGDDRVGNVGSQIGRTFNVGHRAWAPTFVAGFKMRGRTQGKSRNQFQAEIVGMVVVHQKHHVGLVVLVPLFGKLIAIKYFFPIRFVFFAHVPSRANGWHV